MTDRSDIAIVGMAGLYAKADDIDVFWSNILNKVDAVTESSEEWLGDPALYDPETTEPDRLYTRRGGFLGDLARFDARSFGTMPRSVTGAQPDQFLGLKLARDALLDAGCVPGEFDGRSTGVILGHAVHANRANTNGTQQIWFHAQARRLLQAILPDVPEDRIAEAVRMMQKKLPEIAVDSVPGLVPNILTGRIANRLDLMGPNYIIDAACSSSLIAIDLAIGELRSGRADMMLAGGVNTTTSPLVYNLFCSVSALSRTGRIRPFDTAANGTTLGEGAGIVVLKRLEDALRAEDRIYAVIKGVGQSSDGKSSGLMAPRLEGEVLAMHRAYQQTGIDPATIGLVEAHGTGIPLGDRTEVDALRAVFGARRGAVPTVPLGSIKSMIGHCIPASGSASVIKLALALDRKIVPPTLCDEVSEDLGLESTPFYVATEAQPWLHGAREPRRAAINAFGFGGINAHMILEESPVGRTVDATAAFMPVNPAPARLEQTFVLAAADRSALLAALGEARETVERDPGLDLDDFARGLWSTAADGPHRERLALVAADRDDLLKKLGAAAERVAERSVTTVQTRTGIYFQAEPAAGKIAFLFPGEMAQYPGMMRDAALAFPAVREWFDFICDLFHGEREIGHGDLLLPPPNLLDNAAEERLDRLFHQVDYGSELVFAADQAAFALLTALGVKPDAMLGHSTGENAALVASGKFDLSRRQVGEMIRGMNESFSTVEQSGVVPKGVLLTVAALDRERLMALLDAHPDVHFTMDNCPNQAVLFGAEAAVNAVQARAVEQGAVCTRLPISWGYHTPYVRPMAEAFGQRFGHLQLVETDVELYSCVEARPFPKDRTGFRATTEAQYTSRVRFTEAVEKLYDDGCRVFIECGPNSNLTAFVRDILGQRPHLAESVDNRRRGTLSQLRHLVARLFTAGVALSPGWLLFPEDSEDAVRRRREREAQRKAQRLPSELAYARFDEPEIEVLRATLGAPAAAPAPAAPLPAAASGIKQEPITPVTPVLPGSDRSPVRQWPHSNGAGAAMAGHIDLMQDFLAAHVPVTCAAVTPRQRRSYAPRGRSETDSRRVMVLDLARSFDLPFQFSAYLMRGAPTLEAMLPYLAERERGEAETLAARFGFGVRWTEWGLSRLAVKRAVGDLVASQSSNRPAEARIEICKREGGAPYVAFADPSVASPSISIAHAEAIGVGAACDGGWRLGIDFDAPRRVRDPADFLDTILSESERRSLRIPADPSAGATLWSLKEAAAKALGSGITGQPRSFAISDYDHRSGSALVHHEGLMLKAEVRRVGEGVCAVAYMQSH